MNGLKLNERATVEIQLTSFRPLVNPAKFL